MNRTPQVSVIVPVYNAARYLKVAVESVLRQTFGDFELLIIDDGSTDGSRQILEEFARRDERVRLRRRANGGYVTALIEMIADARAPLLARMDADDVCLPQRFERQVAYLEAHPDVVAVGCGCELIDERSRRIGPDVLPEDGVTLHEMALGGRTPICHPTLMVRTQAYHKVGGYDPAAMPAEDLDLFLRLAEIGGLANVPEILLRYRVHGGSVSSQHNERQLDVMRAACRRACERTGRQVEFTTRPWRPTAERASRHHFTVLHGRLAYNSREYRTAVVYAWRAIRMRPANADGWNLLKWATIDGVRTALGMLR